MTISYCTPFSIEKNLGKEYNRYVRDLTKSPNDWIFFHDGDVQFLDPFFGKQIADIINRYPNTGIFTCYTNRVGNLRQCYNFTYNNNPNILDHFNIAQKLKQESYYAVSEIRRVISGHMFGFSRKTWEQVGGFSENPREILKVDNRFSRAVLNLNKKILLMKGVYVFHFYRMHKINFRKYKSHLL